jgi:hypothetical protein
MGHWRKLYNSEFFILLIFTKYELEKYQVGRTCSIYAGSEKYVQNLCW